MRFICTSCEKRQEHEVEGNIKICNRCNTRTSYKFDMSKFRKRIGERQYSKKYSGEQSPYWDWVAVSAPTVHDSGEFIEMAEANPDWLSEENTMFKSCSESDKEKFNTLMVNTDKLSKKEKEVIQLLWEGKTPKEVATILNLSGGAMRTYLQRARKKMQTCIQKV